MPFLGHGDPLPDDERETEKGVEVATADALAAFRDELAALGFSADDTRILVRIALVEEARKFGITITGLPQ